MTICRPRRCLPRKAACLFLILLLTASALFAQEPPDASITINEGSPFASGNGHFQVAGTYKLPPANPPKTYIFTEIKVYWAKEPVLKEEDWFSAKAAPNNPDWSYTTTNKLVVGSKYQVKAQLIYQQVEMGKGNVELNAFTVTPHKTVVIK